MTVQMTGEQAMWEVLPLGSTDPEQVAQAADAVAEMVRTLNHATVTSGAAAAALPWPSSVGTVAGRLHAALYGIEQLLGQLAGRMDAIADNPRLYHDGNRADYEFAASSARQAAEDLRRAQAARAQLTGRLQAALGHIGRLGILDEGEQR